MSIVSIFTIILACVLAAISYVDVRSMRVPNMLSALLLVGGLAFWSLSHGGSVIAQFSYGIALAAIMWLIRFGHFRLTGQVGLGLGDVKMAGAGAVWINPLLLPMFIFAATTSA